ncbi:hypothetical protein HK096_003520 [Nowakowskiella sp. JEL0078]|nr:hypothetical protein HK096_003520 [Nowakowskiella sp. JEL0078]
MTKSQWEGQMIEQNFDARRHPFGDDDMETMLERVFIFMITRLDNNGAQNEILTCMKHQRISESDSIKEIDVKVNHGATARCLLEGHISLDTFEMDNQIFIMKDLTNGLQRWFSAYKRVTDDDGVQKHRADENKEKEYKC